ncbi:MAG: sigma-54-dependent Fis family transcriptional regulator [Planctomycetes bacterium]|nr:sigma-54-dependent Fis family transcriptional regulator [Planctomycetota bacterium]
MASTADDKGNEGAGRDFQKIVRNGYSRNDSEIIRRTCREFLKNPELFSANSGSYLAVLNALIDADIIDNNYLAAIKTAKKLLRQTSRRRQEVERWNLLVKLAAIFSDLGNMESAGKYFSKALSVVPAVNERLFRIRTLVETAKSALFSGGEIAGAEENAFAAKKILSYEDPLDICLMTQDILGYVQMYRGRYEDAVKTFLEMNSRLESERIATWTVIERRIHCLNCLAWCHIDSGRIPDARKYLTESEAIIKSYPHFPFPMNELAIREISGIVAMSEGDLSGARRLLESVITSPSMSPRDTLSTQIHCAELDSKEGKADSALQKFISVLDMAARFNQKVEMIEANLGLAELFLSKKSILNCRLHLFQAVEIIGKINSPIWDNRISLAKSQLQSASAASGGKISYEDTSHLLTEINRNLSSKLSLSEILDSLLRYINALFTADRAAACRLEQNSISLTRLMPVDAEITQTVFNAALKHAATVKHFYLSAHKNAHILAIPVIRLSRLTALIYLERIGPEKDFSMEETRLLQKISDATAITIDNAVLHEEKAVALEKLDAANARLRQIVSEQSKEIKETRGLLSKNGTLNISSEMEMLAATQSPKMQAVFNLVDRIADTGLPALIEGETGTGKEFFAHLLHSKSARKDKPFCILNCAAIPDTLFESELFGHKRGAFTGADRDKKGLLTAAHAGTLFLDEIELLSPAAQEKLLRVIEGRPFMPVGGTEAINADVRFIFASNQSLKNLVESGKFREDLFYRLTVVQINLPPLRERREDIPAFVNFIIERNTPDFSTRIVSKEAMAALMEYHWPGNIRELANEIKRACILTDHKIELKNLSAHVLERPKAPVRLFNQPSTLNDAIGKVEAEAVESALYRNRWSRTLTAKELGISRQQLLRLIKRHGLC